MVFLVEDGSSPLANKGATSYVSIVYADAYLADFGAPISWTGLDDADKETNLNIGTRYVDAICLNRLGGHRVDREQSRLWPRYEVTRRDGSYIGADEIPVEVLRATTLAASFSAAGEVLLPTSIADGSLKSKTLKLDVITIAKEYASGGSPKVKQFPLIDYILNDLFESGSNIVLG